MPWPFEQRQRRRASVRQPRRGPSPDGRRPNEGVTLFLRLRLRGLHGMPSELPSVQTYAGVCSLSYFGTALVFFRRVFLIGR